MRVNIKTGLDLQSGSILDNTIGATKSARTSTLLGRDYPVARLQVIADEGTPVKAGEAVLCDRRRPQILLTSPVSGTVSAVHRGARRRLIALEITSDGKAESIRFDLPTTPNRDNIRQLLLQSGLWATLRSRPFGHIPDPEQEPKALLVTAIDTQPLAPDPAVIISKYNSEFSLGLKTLCDLVDAPVYLCKASDAQFRLDCPCRAKVKSFSGAHPAGLVGRHIHSLCPIGFNSDEVWHIEYQDVISLGHLISGGIPWHERVISLAGTAVKKPRLFTVPLGAGIDDIIDEELDGKALRVISGSVLSGHTMLGNEACLGARHRQASVMFESAATRPNDSSDSPFNSGFGAEADTLIPTTILDSLAPPGILVVPLLRALVVGDVERVRDLGALELVEEDLALLSYSCASKTDYGPLLRNMLNQIHREGLSTRV